MKAIIKKDSKNNKDPLNKLDNLDKDTINLSQLDCKSDKNPINVLHVELADYFIAIIRSSSKIEKSNTSAPNAAMLNVIRQFIKDHLKKEELNPQEDEISLKDLKFPY